jgi:Lrp/AsnC family transcriptional regulator, regulator for asnA, asnC and gidA
MMQLTDLAQPGSEEDAQALDRRALGSDELNRKIIAKLQEDGRASYSEIGRDLGLSEGTVRNRVTRMIEARVLRIIAVADPVALGYQGYALVALKLAPGADPRAVSRRFERCEEVTYILFAAGRFNLFVEVICESHAQLTRFLTEHCHSQPDIAAVEPMMALAMYKNLLKWGRP